MIPVGDSSKRSAPLNRAYDFKGVASCCRRVFLGNKSAAMFRELYANEPEKQQRERRNGERNQQIWFADCLGEYLLLAEEERSGGDKQSKAHTPEMSHETLRAGNSSTQKHANVACCREQRYRSHEKIHG